MISNHTMDFRIVFENFSTDKWYQQSEKFRGRLLTKRKSKKISVTKFSKIEKVNFDKKNVFLVSALLLNKHHMSYPSMMAT